MNCSVFLYQTRNSVTILFKLRNQGHSSPRICSFLDWHFHSFRQGQSQCGS
jgi:hypothetical protein